MDTYFSCCGVACENANTGASANAASKGNFFLILLVFNWLIYGILIFRYRLGGKPALFPGNPPELPLPPPERCFPSRHAGKSRTPPLLPGYATDLKNYRRPNIISANVKLIVILYKYFMIFTVMSDAVQGCGRRGEGYLSGVRCIYRPCGLGIHRTGLPGLAGSGTGRRAKKNSPPYGMTGSVCCPGRIRTLTGRSRI